MLESALFFRTSVGFSFVVGIGLVADLAFTPWDYRFRTGVGRIARQLVVNHSLPESLALKTTPASATLRLHGQKRAPHLHTTQPPPARTRRYREGRRTRNNNTPNTQPQQSHEPSPEPFPHGIPTTAYQFAGEEGETNQKRSRAGTSVGRLVCCSLSDACRAIVSIVLEVAISHAGRAL